ncbi:MAG: ABC transporter ATP-binding protein [Candidatus Binatia bacterium]
MAAVAFDHVEKQYANGVRAVADCTLAIDDGELMVVVGPSGCGKSTLLRMLAGLETVTAGAIRIGDRVVNDLSPQARNVAMVFQDYALYPFMTVRKNLAFPLKMRGLARDEVERRIAAAAEMLDMGALLERLPRQLSGGQRQRVAMGRALVREPSVSLLDEPLSNLDAKLRVEVRAQIAELQQRTRTTMIYVTHDQTEAMTLGHRIAVLDRGVLQQVAAPRALYDRPANAFVASFIGNPPMNVFPVRVERHAGGAWITVAGQTLEMPGLVLAEGVASAGIRPEAFALGPDGGPGALAATVEHVEFLGHETLVHAAVGDLRLVARLEGMHALAKGDRIHLGVAPQHVHQFDHGGLAITLR